MTMSNEEIISPDAAHARRNSGAAFGGAAARGPIIDQEGREIPPESLGGAFGGLRFDFGHASANPFGNLTREQRLARLDAVAKLLDIAFILPGTNIRYGIDGIIGLISVVGDIVATALSLWLVREARARRALAHHGADARQCRNPGCGRNGAGRRRCIRRAVPRQHPQRANAAALDGQAAALARDPEKWEPVFRKGHAPKIDQAASASCLSLAGAGSGARGRRSSGKSWLSYSVRMPL